MAMDDYFETGTQDEDVEEESPRPQHWWKELSPDAVLSMPFRLEDDQHSLDLSQVEIKTAEVPIDELVRMVRSGQINIDPPYQREEVWTTGQKQAFISFLSRSQTKPVPIILCRRGDPAKNRKKIAESDTIDGKQRLSTMRDFFDNRLPMPLESNTGENGSIRWEDIQVASKSNPAFETLEETFRKRTVPVTYYDAVLSLAAQEMLFRLVNNGTPLNTDEKIYCPNFLSRPVLRHVFQTAFSPARGFFQKSIREQKRFKDIRVAHELMLLTVDGLLVGSDAPRDLKTKPLSASAAYIQRTLRKAKVDYEDTWTPEMLEKHFPGLSARLEQMGRISQHLVTGLELLDTNQRRKTGGHSTRDIVDPLGFLDMLVSNNFVTLSDDGGDAVSLSEMHPARIQEWLAAYQEEKSQRDFNMTTTDGRTITMKYGIMTETFFRVVKKSVPDGLKVILDHWVSRYTEKT